MIEAWIGVNNEIWGDQVQNLFLFLLKEIAGVMKENNEGFGLYNWVKTGKCIVLFAKMERYICVWKIPSLPSIATCQELDFSSVLNANV